VSDEVQMTVRIAPELHADFTEAVTQDERPMTQMLQEIMQAYVEASRTRRAQVAGHGGASRAERVRREEAVAFARASVGLEGFTPSAQAALRARQFIDGEIDLAEFVRVAGGTQEASSH